MKTETLNLIAWTAVLLALVLSCQPSKADLPDNALPLLMLERQGADETEVRKVLGKPIVSACTATQLYQTWLDYSPADRPCSVVARFIAGIFVVVSPGELIVVARRSE